MSRFWSLLFVLFLAAELHVGSVEADGGGDGVDQDCDGITDVLPATRQPPVSCDHGSRMQEIIEEIRMIRNAVKHVLTESCQDMDDALELDCSCTEQTGPYTVSVVSEGGSPAGNAATESQAQGYMFTIDGAPVDGAPNFVTGLNFVVIQRLTKEVTGVANFDLWGSDEDEDVAAYVDNIPSDSVVLVSVFNQATGNVANHPALFTALRRLGLVKRFTRFDSYALVGYKLGGDVCGPLPDFITEEWAAAVPRSGRSGRGTPPVTAEATINRICPDYPTGEDFELSVVSEGDTTERAIEYPPDNDAYPSLFFINGERVLGAPWVNGFNVAVIDPVLRQITSSAGFVKRDMDDFVHFVSNVPDDNVVAVTLHGSVTPGCDEACTMTLESLGADTSDFKNGELKLHDSFTVIGYKGYCDGNTKPDWVTTGFVKNPRNSRGQDKSEPLTTTTVIPGSGGLC